MEIIIPRACSKKKYLNTFCKNAEFLQKKLILLKTNFLDDQRIKNQVDSLDRTFNYFQEKYNLK